MATPQLIPEPTWQQRLWAFLGNGWTQLAAAIVISLITGRWLLLVLWLVFFLGIRQSGVFAGLPKRRMCEGVALGVVGCMLILWGYLKPPSSPFSAEDAVRDAIKPFVRKIETQPSPPESATSSMPAARPLTGDGVAPAAPTRTAQAHSSPPPGPLAAEVSADMITRMYGRALAPIPPATQSVWEFQSKQLFYEWTLRMTPPQDAEDVLVIVRDEQKHDDERVRVSPTSGNVSGFLPQWASGFVEPGREPDYFIRKIAFPYLEKNQPVLISIRRPIKFASPETTLMPVAFTRSVTVSAKHFTVRQSSYSPEKDLQRLARHLDKVANWKNGDKVIPIEADPDIPHPPLGPSELEAFVEAHCQEESCEHLLVTQLGGRKSKQ